MKRRFRTKTFISKTLTLGSLLFITACGPTKYAHNSRSWLSPYGYDEVPLDSTTYRVTFEGNTQTSAELVDRYALYRAAEITVSKGYDYYIIIDAQKDATVKNLTYGNFSSDHTEIHHEIDPETGKSIPVATTTSDGMYSGTTTTEHSVTKTIRMFKGNRPADNPAAYDARSMVVVMTPYIAR